MEIIGRIKKIMDVQNLTETFKIREFVLTTDINTPYPQHILFRTTQEKCALLDNLKVNDEVKVFFNIRGREWTAQDGQIKYFVTLEAWRIDKFTPVDVANNTNNVSSANTSPTSPTSSPSQNVNTNVQINNPTTPDVVPSDDDLPF